MKLKILEHKKINSNTFCLKWEKPKDLFFYPGQYLDINLPIQDLDKRGKTRGFTIAASPTEDYLMTCYRVGISDFKTHLNILKKGEVVESSSPVGTFILDETEPTVFFAGGIGITPFRSMIKYALDKKLKIPITLIYSNHNAEFVFKDELDKWQKEYKKLKIIYINTSKEGRLDVKKLKALYPIHHTLYTLYYLAGPQSMINDFTEILKEHGVDEINIRIDPFDGY